MNEKNKKKKNKNKKKPANQSGNAKYSMNRSYHSHSYEPTILKLQLAVVEGRGHANSLAREVWIII